MFMDSRFSFTVHPHVQSSDGIQVFKVKETDLSEPIDSLYYTILLLSLHHHLMTLHTCSCWDIKIEKVIQNELIQRSDPLHHTQFQCLETIKITTIKSPCTNNSNPIWLGKFVLDFEISSEPARLYVNKICLHQWDVEGGIIFMLIINEMKGK